MSPGVVRWPQYLLLSVSSFQQDMTHLSRAPQVRSGAAALPSRGQQKVHEAAPRVERAGPRSRRVPKQRKGRPCEAWLRPGLFRKDWGSGEEAVCLAYCGHGPGVALQRAA